MSAERTYLDYNASAPLRPEARTAMLAALQLAGNPSSVHAEGRRARSCIETARDAVAALARARAADIVFTSGASEANATVLAAGWDTIFLSDLEHDSVRAGAKRTGATVIDMPVSRQGSCDVAGFAARLSEIGQDRQKKSLVCVQLANNETGVIQPVAEIATLARAGGLRVHCDAVQAPGRLAIDCAVLGVHYLTLSAHKLGGPKGVGALICIDGAPLPGLIAGGGQERGRRAGTENVAAIAGFGAAATAAVQDLAVITKQRALRDTLEAGMARVTPDAIVIGGTVPRLPNTCCVALSGLTAETLVIRFDLAGVAISAGAACSSGKVGASAALASMGLGADVARSAIRISLGYATTTADVEAFLKVWEMVAAAKARAA